jgi:hypothetical protein
MLLPGDNATRSGPNEDRIIRPTEDRGRAGHDSSYHRAQSGLGPGERAISICFSRRRCISSSHEWSRMIRLNSLRYVETKLTPSTPAQWRPSARRPTSSKSNSPVARRRMSLRPCSRAVRAAGVAAAGVHRVPRASGPCGSRPTEPCRVGWSGWPQRRLPDRPPRRSLGGRPITATRLRRCSRSRWHRWCKACPGKRPSGSDAPPPPTVGSPLSSALGGRTGVGDRM